MGLPIRPILVSASTVSTARLKQMSHVVHMVVSKVHNVWHGVFAVLLHFERVVVSVSEQ
jgi:hypothetical protein